MKLPVTFFECLQNFGYLRAGLYAGAGFYLLDFTFYSVRSARDLYSFAKAPTFEPWPQQVDHLANRAGRQTSDKAESKDSS
ncbi:unnamed protein product [Amoebophrya sp. A25]|nr:unnamed protein product [Amoebophrya sp. A25]|eukprot:GSA25T00020174001.1